MARFLLLVKGTPIGFFLNLRVLRQGDSIFLSICFGDGGSYLSFKEN